MVITLFSFGFALSTYYWGRLIQANPHGEAIRHGDFAGSPTRWEF